MGKDVGLGQPPVDTCTPDRGRVEVVLLDKAAHSRRQRQIGRRGRCDSGCRGGGCGFRGRSHGGGGGSGGGTFIQDGKAGTHLDAAPLGGDDLAKRTGSRCRHLERHLVGLELDNRLIGGDGIAGLLDPAGHRRIRYGFTKSGNCDFDRHGAAASSVRGCLRPCCQTST